MPSQLAAEAVDAFASEIDRLPRDARQFLHADEFLDRLRRRCDSVADTAARNRRRAAEPRRPR